MKTKVPLQNFLSTSRPFYDHLFLSSLVRAMDASLISYQIAFCLHLWHPYKNMYNFADNYHVRVDALFLAILQKYSKTKPHVALYPLKACLRPADVGSDQNFSECP